MFNLGFHKLLRNYPQALGDRRQFASLLRDLMPAMALQANLLLNSYDLGIHSEIEKAEYIDNAFAFRFIKKLCDEYGVSRRNADWAVETWCSCYADRLLDKKVEINLDSPPPQGDAGESAELPETTLDVSTNEYLFDWRNIFDYTIENNSVIIEKYVDFDAEEVEIPVTIEGFPVTEIGEEAFQNCSAMKTIHLPDTLRIIRRKAFENCTFESIALPESLTEIEYRTFGENMIESVRFPSRIKRVNRYVFYCCERLRKVELPKELKAIEGFAFAGCTSLKCIDIPEGTRELGELAFSDCDNLEKIRIPRSVVIMGRQDSDKENVFWDKTRENITIYCQAGSEALKYARHHGIKMDKYENYCEGL